MTARGRRLCEVLGGAEIVVSQTAMEHLCIDLSVGGRSLRSIRAPGGWRVSLVGASPAEGSALAREVGG